MGVQPRGKKQAAAHRQDRRRSPPPESDDDEETPEWAIKAENRAQGAKSGSAAVAESLVGLSRKRPFETSQLSEESDGDAIETTNNGRRRKTAEFARISSKFTSSKPSKPNAARPPPVFKPASRKPLPRPQWTIPSAGPAKEFRQPTSSLKVNAICEASVNKNQKASAQARPSQTEDTNSSEPSYAEIVPFEFKLVVSYSGDGMEFYQSTDLENEMKSFWSTLKRLRKGWEEAAGAEWAWELQKPSKARNGRLCVSTTLAKQSTRWREGDSGDYACSSCAMNASLCFTWVKDEDAEHEHEDETTIPDPKGEFWCLPVHPVDSRCKAAKGREIRTWLNEGDNSESDSSGEEIGESSEEDEFKVGSDYDQLSESESSSEEEDNAKGSDEDDEL